MRLRLCRQHDTGPIADNSANERHMRLSQVRFGTRELRSELAQATEYEAWTTSASTTAPDCEGIVFAKPMLIDG